MVTGPDGTVLPRDLLSAVLGFVMPMWDPLRRAGRAGRGQDQQEEEEEEDKAAKSKCKGERVMFSRDECRSSTLLWRDGEMGEGAKERRSQLDFSRWLQG